MRNAKRRIALAVAVLGLLAGAAGQARAGLQIGYGTGPDPWGNTTNDTAMNTVFGVGNWNKFDFSTVSGAAALDTALTSGNYKMIFLDGGDGASSNFNNFVNNYRSDLQSFVNGGGALILNAARWSGGPLDLGFGVTLTTGDYSPTGTASDPSNTLFQDHGFGAPGTSWTGFYFSHDYLSGTVGTVLITGNDGKTVLSEENYGSGFVMFGGITTPNFQGPGTAPYSLRDNMLYVAGQFTPGVAAVPEPATIIPGAIAGLMGIGYGWRRRRARASA